MIHKANPDIYWSVVIPQGVEDSVSLGQNFIVHGKKEKAEIC